MAAGEGEGTVGASSQFLEATESDGREEAPR